MLLSRSQNVQSRGKWPWSVRRFEGMEREGISPNDVTFICILKACGSIQAIEKGEQIHDEIVNRGLLEKNIMIGNALMDMYVKCGALGKTQQVLPSNASYSKQRLIDHIG